MIRIIGDTVGELANLQILIETAMLNNNENIKLNIIFKLLSGNILLVDQYNHIVGEKEQEE